MINNVKFNFGKPISKLSSTYSKLNENDYLYELYQKEQLKEKRNKLMFRKEYEKYKQYQKFCVTNLNSKHTNGLILPNIYNSSPDIISEYKKKMNQDIEETKKEKIKFKERQLKIRHKNYTVIKILHRINKSKIKEKKINDR
ncbi:MAG: hypothetical protein MJ252_08940 [archaeon]|nr:hypothetical protein [archaeon]